MSTRQQGPRLHERPLDFDAAPSAANQAYQTGNLDQVRERTDQAAEIDPAMTPGHGGNPASLAPEAPRPGQQRSEGHELREVPATDQAIRASAAGRGRA